LSLYTKVNEKPVNSEEGTCVCMTCVTVNDLKKQAAETKIDYNI